MSNLSDLLPAGAGGKQVSFTADGSISQGDTVVLQSNGTVAAGQSFSDSTGSAQEVAGTNDRNNAVVYHTGEDRVVVFYTDSSNSYAMGRAGSISGKTITWGTATTIDSTSSMYPVNAIYDSVNNKIVLAYRDEGYAKNYLRLITLSGSTISVGTRYEIGSYGTASQIGLSFDPTYNVVVFVCNNSSGYAIAQTFDASNGTFGTDENLYTTNNVYFFTVNYYSSIDRHIATFAGTSNQSRYSILQITAASGANITFTGSGSGATLSSSVSQNDINYVTYYDAENDRLVELYVNSSSPYQGKAVAHQFSTSTKTASTSIVNIDGTNPLVSLQGGYNAYAKKGIVIHRNDNSPYANHWRSVEVDVSGDTVTIGSSRSIGNDYISNTPGVAEDPDTKQTIFVREENSVNDLDAFVVQISYSNVTAADFIGLAADAISDTASGDINVKGGINEAQSGLTIGSDYYVQDNGTLSTTTSTVKVGKAITATTINMMDLT